MTLIIKAVSYKDAPLTHEIGASFEAQGGSIGRSPENQLVLPDPEKFISRLHAHIRYEGGKFLIEDCSAGGTYLTQQGQLLQQNRALLTDGERLRIGEYELVVSIAESAPPFSTPYSADYAEPVRQLDLAASSALDGPFGSLPQPSAAQPSFIEQPDAAVFHQSFTPPEAKPVGRQETKDDLDFGDLLSTLDHLPGPKSVPAASPPLPADFPELPADFFADDLQPAAPLARQAPAELPASPFSAAADAKGAKEPIVPPPAFSAIPDAASAAPFGNDPLLGDALAPERRGGVSQAQDAFASPPKPAPAVAQPHAAGPAPVGAQVPDSELVRAFLEGAGIGDSGLLPPEQWQTVFKTSGELLRSMVEGLMCVLRARAELKSQFRVSVTTMRSVDNNPLKFTPSVDDALRLILAPTNPGFLTPKEAVREGFADIMNHQMAMTAGIQAALADVLQGFDPELIEKALGDGLQFQKKAKCWEHYSAQYPKLKAAAQEEFFGDAFGDAYEQQMQMLSRSSKRSP